VAKAVGHYLTDTVNVDIYLSDSDEYLQTALMNNDDEKIVKYIEQGMESSTHLLGIISNRTRDSWWVPFEFGADRQRMLRIAQLLLEEVIDAPSYLKIAEILRDSDDLSKWATKTLRPALKSATELPRPNLPRVAIFKSSYPRWR